MVILGLHAFLLLIYRSVPVVVCVIYETETEKFEKVGSGARKFGKQRSKWKPRGDSLAYNLVYGAICFGCHCTFPTYSTCLLNILRIDVYEKVKCLQIKHAATSSGLCANLFLCILLCFVRLSVVYGMNRRIAV